MSLPLVLTILTVIFGVTTTAMTLLYLSEHSRLKRHRTEREEVKEKYLQQAQEIIDQARMTAARLIQDAYRQQGQIVTDAEEIRASVTSQLQQNAENIISKQSEVLEKSSSEIREAYEKEIQILVDKSIKDTQSILNSINGLAEASVRKFDQMLEQQTANSAGETKRQLDEIYQKALAEISNYKTTRLKNVDKEIANVVDEVFDKVVRKSLTVEDHERLIMEALEKARKDGIFSS
jgi:F0F1-type ATP synthase membrane subunit b/b'